MGDSLYQPSEADLAAEREVDEWLGALSDVAVPALSHDGLVWLRDAIGTKEFVRAIAKVGLDDPDAAVYARRTALAVCAVLEQLRLQGPMDPVRLALNAAAIGYERGVRDATDLEMSPEGMRTIADKVDREEEGGREVERFRRELEDL